MTAAPKARAGSASDRPDLLAIDPGPIEVERVMEDLIHHHLIDLVAMDRLGALQEAVVEQLFEMRERGQLGDLTQEQVSDRAVALVIRAWQRVLDVAVLGYDLLEPDDDCALCQMLAGSEPTEPGSHKRGHPKGSS